MSHRIEQLQATIQRRIGELLARGLADPRVRGMITITEVKLSDDQSQAVIGISVLPEEHANLTLKGVTSAAKYLRRELGATLTTRRVPRLIFRLDDRLKKQARVITAVNQAMAETGEAPPHESPGEVGADAPTDETPTGAQPPTDSAADVTPAPRQQGAAARADRRADDEIESHAPTDEDPNP